jgi:hypothetical protein
MKKLLLICLLPLALAACNTPTVTTPTPAAVQSLAVGFCAYEPTIATVAKIISSSPYLDTADTIAKAICNAVTINPLADGPGPKNYRPQINGVIIQGHFVK